MIVVTAAEPPSVFACRHPSSISLSQSIPPPSRIQTPSVQAGKDSRFDRRTVSGDIRIISTEGRSSRTRKGTHRERYRRLGFISRKWLNPLNLFFFPFSPDASLDQHPSRCASLRYVIQSSSSFVTIHHTIPNTPASSVLRIIIAFPSFPIPEHPKTHP